MWESSWAMTPSSTNESWSLALGDVDSDGDLDLIFGNRGQVNYSASKAGLIGATRSLSLELAKRRITVNSVAPGLIETEMTAGLPADEVSRLIPMQRMGTPEEVAAVVGFLFSLGASYITGQVISVNGGLG